MFKFLDCFCGMGGASEGFAKEGFDCTGIDVVNVGYPYNLLLKDMRKLHGKDFKEYDVIWGSPPCREFTVMVKVWGHKWKEKPNFDRGLNLVKAYFSFLEGAKPKIWIMENVPNLTKYILIPPQFVGRIGKSMRRAFWGNFPPFLMPMGKKESIWRHKWDSKLRSWERAKIPLACSQAFAKACKEKLLNA